LSSTVLFSEGCQCCDAIGRFAPYARYDHNFGLNWYQQANPLMFRFAPPAGAARLPPLRMTPAPLT